MTQSAEGVEESWIRLEGELKALAQLSIITPVSIEELITMDEEIRHPSKPPARCPEAYQGGDGPCLHGGKTPDWRFCRRGRSVLAKGAGSIHSQFTMRSIIAAALALCFLNSCVFEEPFEPKALLPVDPALLGRWEEVVAPDSGSTPNELLVLQHSANEYLVRYPTGEKAMFFRAYAVELSGGRYIQIQLIGTAGGAVKPEDRKFHLLQVTVHGSELEFRTIIPDAFGKNLKGAEAMRDAFALHKNDEALFAAPQRFVRK